MSNKKWDAITDIDKTVRRLCPVGMDDGVHLTIEFFTGFEKFNSRPYHNYETWSGGYRVKGTRNGITVTVEEEDLDDALAVFERKTNSPARLP